MSKRRRKGSGGGHGADGGDGPQSRGAAARPRARDPRAIEGTHAATQRILRTRGFKSIEEVNEFLRAQRMLTDYAPIEAATALEAAQDLMYKAFQEVGRKRVRLARRALATCAECADAYVVLSEETARTLDEALGLYEAGAAAGERALGRAWIEAHAGDLWMHLEARPYMRSLRGLASCLWEMDRKGESISRYQEMLRLNRNDNQGARYVLICHLIDEGRDAEASRLLAAFRGEGTAWWAFSRALLAFRFAGATRTSNMHLGRAMRANPYVVMLLLDVVPVPPEMPRTWRVGEPDEAVLYFRDAHEGWSATEGALEWLEDRMHRLSPPRGPGHGATPRP
jgi:tetratricopeptide (TPR) repeat protein